MAEKTELQIIEQVKRGNTDAFGELVEKHQKLVYNLALKMLGNPEDAEDAAQEAFIKAYRSIGSFRGESKFSVWLYKLTNNVCLDMLRKKREATFSLSVEDCDGEEGEIEIADGRFAPHEVYEKKAMREALHKGLSELEEDFRSVLVLREVNGLSYDEIAGTLDLDPGTVKSRIFRARKKLCAILTRDGNFFGFSSSNQKEGGRKS